MAKKFVYLLEHCETGQPTVIGIFESKALAEQHLRRLDKSFAYAIYRLPFNTILTEGEALADQQGVYDHWHYGTNEVEVIEVDDEGNVLKEALETSLEWPD